MWSCINGFYSVKPTLISVLVNLQCFGFSYSINGVKRHQTLERWNEFSLEAGLKFIQQLQHRKKQTGIQTSSPSPLHSPSSFSLPYWCLHSPPASSLFLLSSSSSHFLPHLLHSQWFHWRMLPVHVWISPPIVHCCCRRNDPGEMCHCPGVQQLPTPWHSELSSLQDLKEQQ